MSKLSTTIISVIFILIFFSLASAQESITITTYYPSPYGSYAELRADRMAIGSGYRTVAISPPNGLIVQGSVGIGTNSPGEMLNLQSDADADLLISTAAAGDQSGIILRRARGTYASPTAVNNLDLMGVVQGQGYDGGAYRAGSDIQFVVDGTPAAASSFPGMIKFRTVPSGSLTGVDRMVIKNTGNIGIGTTTPTQKLEVNGGNIWIRGSQLIIDRQSGSGEWEHGIMYYPTNNSSGTELAGIGLYGTDTTVSRMYLAHGNDPWNSTTGMHILTNGNTGIGTTTPADRLEVSGNVALKNDNADGPQLRLYGLNSADPWEIDSYNNSLRFRRGGVDKMIITASGNIGLGRSPNVTESELLLSLRDKGYSGSYIFASSGQVYLGRSAPVLLGIGNLLTRYVVANSLTVAGVKSFLINHPTKPGMQLVHACIEGPEAGVYYRGEAQLSDGKAAVKLPDYFEALTRKEGRTVQLAIKGTTPFLLSYTDITNGEFAVYGTKADGDFSWEVKAVRADVEPLMVEKPVEK